MPFFSGLVNAGVYSWQVLASKKPRMAYVGGWQRASNLGDVSFYPAMKRLFYAFGLLQYRAVRSIELASKALPKFEIGVLGGGTIINRQIGSLVAAERAIHLCKNFFVFGSGVANPDYWKTQDNWQSLLSRWKPVLEKCHFVGVRGPMSAEILADAGVSDVKVVGDPTLTFALDENSKALDSSRRILGINIGQSNGLIWGGDEGRVCQEVAKLAIQAKLNDWEVEWFIVYPKDRKITKRAASLSQTGKIVHETYRSPERYLNLVRRMTAFVGMKLHAVIFATCAFVPSVMLEYRPKCLDYMKSIGHEEFNIRTDKFKGEKLWEIVQTFSEERCKYSETLRNKVILLKKKQLREAEQLMDQLV